MRWKIIVPCMLLIAGIGAGIALHDDEDTYGTAPMYETAGPGRFDGFEGRQYVTHDDLDRMEFFVPSEDRITTDIQSLHIEAAWTDAAEDVYDHLMLYVRTAASREPLRVGPITPFAPLDVAVTPNAADRDGQAKSAWSFIVRPEGSPLRFGAWVDLTVTVTEGAVTGPVADTFLSPDTLLSVRDSFIDVDRRFQVANQTVASYDERPMQQYFLEPGARVEPGTDRLVVKLIRDSQSPERVRLGYMDGASNEWHWRMPDAVSGYTSTYVIPVSPDQADAPDIPTGLWRFTVDAVGDIGGGSTLLGADLGIAYEGFQLEVTR